MPKSKKKSYEKRRQEDRERKRASQQSQLSVPSLSNQAIIGETKRNTKEDDSIGNGEKPDLMEIFEKNSPEGQSSMKTCDVDSINGEHIESSVNEEDVPENAPDKRPHDSLLDRYFHDQRQKEQKAALKGEKKGHRLQIQEYHKSNKQQKRKRDASAREKEQEMNKKRCIETRKISSVQRREQLHNLRKPDEKRQDQSLRKQKQIIYAKRRAEKRQDPCVRKQEQMCDTKRRREKRQTQGVREQEQIYNTMRRKEKRQDQSIREREQTYNTKRRKQKRQDESIREREQTYNTKRRKQKRQDESIREQEQTNDSRRRKEKRQDESFREREQTYNTKRRKQKRQDESIRQQEQTNDSRRRKEKRQDESFREREQTYNTKRRKQKRQDESIRQQEQTNDTRRRKEKRQDESIHEREQTNDTRRRKEKRQDESIREREQTYNTKRRKQKRQDESIRGQEQTNDTRRRKEKRQDQSIRERDREKAKEATRKRSQRETSLSAENAVSKFHSDIQNGPTYVCTICLRLLKASTVVKFIDNKFEDQKQLVESCRTKQLSVDGTEYICVTCRNFICKGELPQLASANGLQLDDVPQTLKDLNQLESTFISRRIQFMKLLALPRGKQKAIHGCVVNVPVEPSEMTSILPRVPSSQSMVCVKLKRKLQYRGHSFKQNIRPHIIKDALYLLKNTLQNELYSDVEINENWMEDCENQESDLWDSLVGDAECEGSEDQMMNMNARQGTETVDSDIEEDEEYQNEEDERSRLSGLPFDTCLMPKDLTADSNLILNVAPGEGKRPQGMEMDVHSEELSFPTLFPSGKFGYSFERQKKLGLKKYFQSRMLHCDGRFAKNIEYLFYAQYRCEAKEIRDSLSVALRKGKGEAITAKEVKEKISSLARNDLGIHFLQKIRGSPAFFNKLLYDLLGMIRQLGPCTWFITLSAADLKWKDTIRVIAAQQGQALTDEEIATMSWEERCTLLRSNPVTAATHFDDRVKLFMKNILLNKQLNPLGDIMDYKYRIEFQQRGSPHVHMLAWVRHAPTFEDNTEEDVKKFVDKYISCSIPNDDPELADLLFTVNRHTHSVACRKHGTTCRFQFPRSPVNETIAVKPMESPPQPVQEMFVAALESVQQQLQSNESESEELTIDDILRKANVSESLYIRALKWIKTKSGQPAIILKRNLNEININNYNPILMDAWEANLDVQYVTNVYSCIMYVASYISKPEKTLGDVLKGISNSSQHLGAKASMQNIAKKFLSHREVSAQEAVYRLMSLPLTKGSREIIFISTDLPENRTRLFKPLKMIDLLEDDDPDVFQYGYLERYPNRPKKLEDMCLAEFVSTYKYSSKDQRDEDSAVGTNLPKHITLKRGLGCMTHRSVIAFIRSHQWSVRKQPEQYYHALLLLYYPWRNECRDLLTVSYRESFMQNLDVIQTNRKKFEKHAEDVDDAIHQLEEFGPTEDSWLVLAPQTEQNRIEEAREGREEEQSVTNAYDAPGDGHSLQELGILDHHYELDTESMSNNDWHQLVLSLNSRQYEVHQYIVDWCNKMLLCHLLPKPPPFHIFLTGGAGVGKSHLVRTIVQTVQRLLSRDNQTDDNHILVCAPTGAAAYNISGHTLHSAFLLPLHSRKTDDYIPVAGEKLAALKEAIGSIKVLVIDEISMVGSDMLLTIHRRLCDIMCNDDPFGGISILAVGDLFQLPPVAQKPVYAEPSDELAAIYGSLWKNLFHVVELTEIQRQKNDEEFAFLLNRVRVGDYIPEDLKLLKSRQISLEKDEYPKDATHIFAFNRQVNDHNESRLKHVLGQKITLNALDARKDDQTGQIDTTSFESMAGGLQKSLTLVVGARVMLIKNLDVQDGLVNSAAGVVTGFHPGPPVDDLIDYRPKFILVKFDDKRVGQTSRRQHRQLSADGSTPIPFVESQVRIGKYSKITKKRSQFPLALAWGVTIHKEQGKTENQLVLSCKGHFQAGQFYTAVSRTKTLDGLFILDEVSESKIKVNKKSITEINRMKKDKSFHFRHCKSIMVSKQTHFKILSQNINSICAHIDCIRKEIPANSFHVMCFQESWLKPSDPTPWFEHCNCLRNDGCTNAENRKGGLLMYIHEDFLLLLSKSVDSIKTEHQLAIISPKEDPTLRICIVSVYRNPKLQFRTFLTDIENILHAIPLGLPVMITGDFNVDIRKKQTSSKELLNLFQHHGVTQCLQTPTHRRGGLLDHMYTNMEPDALDVTPTYFSDHFMVSMAVPFQTFQ